MQTEQFQEWFNKLHEKVGKYDATDEKYTTLYTTWKKEVEERIEADDQKQAAAIDGLNSLYANLEALHQKTEAFLNQAHTRIAELSATGGKGKGGSKWELSRTKDIEPSTFDGKEESWPKWKEEL